MTTQDGNKHTLMVCIGNRRIKEGKTCQYWISVSEDGYKLVGNQKSFSRPVKGATPGSIYKFTNGGQSESSFFISGPDGPKFIGMYPEEELVLEWQAAHEAQELAAQTDRRETKDKDSHSKLIRHLRPLRTAYLNEDTRGRRALLVLAMEYIQNG